MAHPTAKHAYDERSVLEQAALAVIVLDDQDAVVEAVGENDALEVIAPTEVVGRPAIDVLRDVGVAPALPSPGETMVAVTNGRRLELRLVRAGPATNARSLLVAIDVSEHAAKDASYRARALETRALFRQLPGAAWMVDCDLRIIQFLGHVEENIGIPHDRIRGMSVQDIAETRDATDPATVAHIAALTGHPSSFRYFLRGHWYEVHVEPLRDGEHAVIGALGVAVEVTQRIANEQQAAQREAELLSAQRHTISILEATLEATVDGILVVDRAFKIVMYNTRFLQMWSIPEDVAAKRDNAQLLAHVFEQLADPELFLREVLAVHTSPEEVRIDIVTFRDGRVFERCARAQRIDGTIVGRVLSFRDITERQRALRSAVFLADASRLLGSLDAAAGIEAVARLAVPVFDADCAVDVLEKGELRRLASASRTPASPATSQSAILSGRPIVRMREDHTELTVPMVAAGRVLGALTFTTSRPRTYEDVDIELADELGRRCAIALENARLYHAARDQIRAREEFLAVASHEIRGPIASVRLALDALAEKLAPADHLIDVIGREERRLARLVDELLDLERVRHGSIDWMIEDVDLTAIVHDVAARLEPELAQARCRLTIHGLPSLQGQWDRMRLDQVVMNLLSNAIKFGRGKPIEVDIALDASEQRATLAITDHGIGIRPDQLRTIFEPFERAVPARHYGGLGLGLYVVSSIVSALGGSIDVASAPEAGATFSITLPRTRAA